MKFGFKATVVFCLPIVLIIALGIQSQAVGGNAERGAELYKKCSGCHGDKPKFSAKSSEYLNDKMLQIRAGSSDNAKVKKMQDILKSMSEEHVKDITTYLKSL